MKKQHELQEDLKRGMDFEDDTARKLAHVYLDSEDTKNLGRMHRPDLGKLVDAEVIILTPQQLAGLVMAVRVNSRFR